MELALRPGVLTGGEFRPYRELLEQRFPHYRRCRAGEVIFGQGERGRQVCYYLVSGHANSYLLHESGGAVELTARRPGSIFPLYYSFQTTSTEMVLQIVATTDCDLLVIPRAELRLLMIEKPDIAVTMLDAYGAFATYLDYTLASRLFDSLETRVCNFLYLHLSEDDVVNVTQDEIAHAVGASRVKVTVALGNLGEAGIVQTRRGSVKVIDMGRLRNRCSYIAQLSGE